jgi:hypothetical protein
LVVEDIPDLSDSSDDSNLPEEENDMYTPGSAIGTARLTGI